MSHLLEVVMDAHSSVLSYLEAQNFSFSPNLRVQKHKTGSWSPARPSKSRVCSCWRKRMVAELGPGLV